MTQIKGVKWQMGDLFDRPITIESGGHIKNKVKVQHRSDILLDEQIQIVKNVQDALNRSLSELEYAPTQDEFHFHSRQVNELKKRDDELIIIIKVAHQINAELGFARTRLQKALKTDGNVNQARKRVGWLEDRLETLLGRKKQQPSSARAQIRSAMMLDDPHMAMYSSDSERGNMAPGMFGNHDEDCFSDTDTEVSEKSNEIRTLSDTMGVNHEESVTTEEGPENREEKEEDSEDQKTPQDLTVTGKDSEFHPDSKLQKETTATEPPRGPTFITAVPDIPDTGHQDPKEENVPSKTFNTKCDKLVISKSESDASNTGYEEYEHHRYEHSEYADLLCQLNPHSYHQIELAIPGTFVHEVADLPRLSWHNEKEDTHSPVDIHKQELHKLEDRIHVMYDKVYEAAMMSVKQTKPTKFGGTLFNRLGSSLDWKATTDKALKMKSKHNGTEPSMSNLIPKKEPRDGFIGLPLMNTDKVESPRPRNLIYYPRPIPHPIKLPLARLNRKREYPRQADIFLEDMVGRRVPPERFVNQRDLVKETKFTSSLYSTRPSCHSPTGSEVRFHRRILGQGGVSTLSNFSSLEDRGSRSAGSKQVHLKAKSEIGKSHLPRIGATFKAAKAAVALKMAEENKWKKMKPKSGALDHSGLKWERVKSVVQDNLVSVHLQERIDAARLLGALNCGDTMVTFALKDRLLNDDADRVRYEACKSLISLGCWDEEVVARVVQFMLSGNSAIISDMLQVLIKGKNVQYVDKTIPSFSDIVLILSELCDFDEVNDKISLDAAVTLGKLCVVNKNAMRKLRQVLTKNNTHVKAQALEILVRQLNYRDWDMVEAVLEQLQKSPVWKYRKDAATLLITIGKKHVCLDGKVDAVFELLDRQLWDDPNMEVRHEVAKSLAALELFAHACEKAERRLEDPQEDVRAQAVMSLGTLGMKNERVLRLLLDMFELDTCEYVRLMIIRTLAILNSQDPRVLRALHDKTRVGGVLAREARKALYALSLKTKGHPLKRI